VVVLRQTKWPHSGAILLVITIVKRRTHFITPGGFKPQVQKVQRDAA